MEESCALCGKRAGLYCDSDQASLCWGCDENVHSANFLVAKHSRVLLCHLCQSPTPWKASGSRLTPTASLYHHCVSNGTTNFQQLVDDDHHDYEDVDGDYSSYADSDHGYDDDDDDDGEENEEMQEEEGENQMVPWSSASASSRPPPPPPLSANGDTSSATGGAVLAFKRLGHNSFSGDSDDGIECSSALPNDESTSTSVFRPLKSRKVENPLI